MTRIIAGSRKGRRLVTPASDRTRPTTDRVREAIFSTITAWTGNVGAADQALAGLSFLDGYAGSGAMGLEAASRGAESVLFIESERSAVELIRRNCAQLDLQAVIRCGKSENILASQALNPFDIIFLDPPYQVSTQIVDTIVSDLVAHGWLADEGLVIVERSSRTEPVLFGSDFSEYWTRGYGETTIYYATRGSD